MENCIVDAIMSGRFAINSNLPSERELAAQLGVTRPTLREALQRLSRDGWLEIRHGKPTRVKDFWWEGSLGVLNVISKHSDFMPRFFIEWLLVVRSAMAPVYVRLAVEKNPDDLISTLKKFTALEDEPRVFSAFDWQVHRFCITCSGNPIFMLIANSFNELAVSAGTIFFQLPAHRQRARDFYTSLMEISRKRDPDAAEVLARDIMNGSTDIWRELIKEPEIK